MNQIEWLNDTSDNGENCSNNQLAWLGWAPDENDTKDCFKNCSNNQLAWVGF